MERHRWTSRMLVGTWPLSFRVKFLFWPGFHPSFFLCPSLCAKFIFSRIKTNPLNTRTTRPLIGINHLHVRRLVRFPRNTRRRRRRRRSRTFTCAVNKCRCRRTYPDKIPRLARSLCNRHFFLRGVLSCQTKAAACHKGEKMRQVNLSTSRTWWEWA